MNSRGFTGEFDRGSKLSVMRQHYWQAKEAVKRKIKGSKTEDDEFTGSDRELAAKLELFKSIQITSSHLFRFTKAYMDKLHNFQSLQNDLGEYLKTAGARDRTHAGKIFICVGKSMLYSSELLGAVVKPLSRLQSEIEVFRRRAVLDTQRTVDGIEKNRREYRAVLMWMKDASGELDPESYRQMENFRRIQSQVKKSKAKFDKSRRDTIEKVDILAASRCNMFGGPLQAYTDALIGYWEKVSGVHQKIALGFQGYQYYDFSVIKELRDVTKELADRLPSQGVEDQALIDAACADMDQKLFFQEYRDDVALPKTASEKENEVSSKPSVETLESIAQKEQGNDDQPLLLQDLVSGEAPPSDDSVLLDLQTSKERTDALLNQRFDEVFGLSSSLPGATANAAVMQNGGEGDDTKKPPSTIDFWDAFMSAGLPVSPEASPVKSPQPTDPLMESLDPLKSSAPSELMAPLTSQRAGKANSTSHPGPTPQIPKSAPASDKFSWYRQFAELDPLENPSILGLDTNNEGA
ncbi:unnamed protein product [Cyprideis torosa]|uniref:Uncharacterized protein n=1 Tax=Cyprideis torosa TaxID=163714 RepID=A0A7R8ZRG2_9CRUS|nr:unnamed protein product [Cyprideis torosa]CAG0903661.1 unnamed protein product [Cyprideis torosa]